MGRKRSKVPFALTEILPLTTNQEKAFEYYVDDYNLILHGFAGTGKTFLCMYLALDSIINKKEYNRIIIFRSAVPTRDMGFLPGTKEEKSSMFELPYKNMCNELFGRGDAYQILKDKKLVEFETTSFLRGLTFDDSIIIVDECQNMTDQELHTIITRVGENTKILLSGDFNQNDLKAAREKTGITKIFNILSRMIDFKRIEFTTDDVVRSDFVKDYLIARYDYETEYTIARSEAA